MRRQPPFRSSDIASFTVFRRRRVQVLNVYDVVPVQFIGYFIVFIVIHIMMEPSRSLGLGLVGHELRAGLPSLLLLPLASFHDSGSDLPEAFHDGGRPPHHEASGSQSSPGRFEGGFHEK